MASTFTFCMGITWNYHIPAVEMFHSNLFSRFNKLHQMLVRFWIIDFKIVKKVNKIMILIEKEGNEC
jgi:hypothetical protein